jgi:hypothetical protein
MVFFLLDYDKTVPKSPGINTLCTNVVKKGAKEEGLVAMPNITAHFKTMTIKILCVEQKVFGRETEQSKQP